MDHGGIWFLEYRRVLLSDFSVSYTHLLDFAVKDMILEYDMQISSNAADNFMFVTDLRCEDKVDAVRIILYKNAITVISSKMCIRDRDTLCGIMCFSGEAQIGFIFNFRFKTFT